MKRGKTLVEAAMIWLSAALIGAAGEIGSVGRASGARTGGGVWGQVLAPMNRSAPLRAAPLPADSLGRGSMAPLMGAGPVRATHSVPYGANGMRPSGSVVVPFGGSGYYYRR